MIARDLRPYRISTWIAGTLVALSVGCAQDPSATSNLGMFSLPGSVEFQEIDDSKRQELLAEEIAAEREARLAVSIAENLRRAMIETKAGRPDQAAQYYERVLRDDPSNVEAHHRLAVLAEQAGDIYAAERSYLAALELAPNDPDLLRDLDGYYRKQRRFPPSELASRQALGTDSTHKLAMANPLQKTPSTGDDRNASEPAQATAMQDERQDETPSMQSVSVRPDAEASHFAGRPATRSTIVLTGGPSTASLPLWSSTDGRQSAGRTDSAESPNPLP